MRKRDVRGGSLLLCLLMTLGLSGCTVVESCEDYAVQKSGITADEDYKKYEELASINALEPDGSYSLVMDEAERPDGSVCVTFADNPRMQIRYYYDAEMTLPIDSQMPCYVMPGDYIYSSEPVCDTTVSSTYHFTQFNIYAWDGNRRCALAWETSNGTQGLAVQIPADYTGTELSIEPVGAVDDRSLALRDYINNNDGDPVELNGTWIINETATSRASIEVSPIMPLKVEYQYDESEYCFVSSSPGSYYHENGKVIFETVAASEGIETFSVQLRPVEDERFYFDPAEFTFDHGTVSFYYQGVEITAPINLNDGASLTYKVTGTEDGYYSTEPEGTIYINAVDPDATESAVRAIPIFRKEPVLVNLPQPSAGGTVQYLIDGETVEQDVCEVLPGTIITVNFLQWNGWISDCQDGAAYIVEDKTNQTVHIDGVQDLTQVFRESPQHKPILTVELADGITQETQFDIDVAGISADSSDTKTTELTNGGKKKAEIFNGTIGTERGITLTVKNETLTSGMALRLELHMIDDHKNESTAIRYLTKLPCSEYIEIYPDPASDTTIYTEIRLIINKVEVTAYEPVELANGSVEVSLADVSRPQTLAGGEVLEPSRQVRVSIRPDSGYYVAGGNGAADSYSDTMKYSKWLSDYTEIMEKHPIRSFWTITLDAADLYGNCVYELDGKEVSGTVQVKEGQKLTLKYTLTDENYQIVRNGLSGFVGSITGKDSASCAIELSEAMDGITVRRADYIQIERKER